MVAEDIRNELLAEAAACAGPLPGAGDLALCLRVYYRHVAEDDLTEAGAERLAAVTAGGGSARRRRCARPAR